MNQLSQEVGRILTLSDIREKFAGRGVVAKPSTPEEFDKFVRTEVEKITKVMKAGGVKVQ